MGRPKDRKSPEIKMEPFLCPRCGRTFLLKHDKRRKLCKECSILKNKEDTRARVAAALNEKAKYKQMAKPEPPKPKVDEETRLYKLQHKQCVGCHYYSNDGGDKSKFCHYCLRTKRLRDKGNGPGDCRSFEPKRKRTQEEKMAHAREHLIQTEAERYAQKPRKKEEQENATR